jgi:hypothetical protein
MISSRRKVAIGLGATITPPLGSRANAVRTGPISLASRATAAVTETPTEVESGFDRAQESDVCSRLRMMEECYPPHFGRDFLENLQPFPTQLRFEIVETRNVSAWMRQARNEATSDRIGDERKDNGNGLRLLQ